MKRWLWTGPALAALLFSSSSAQARLQNAQFTACNGCHGDNPGAELSVELNPPAPGPGERVHITITVTGPGIQIGGFSIYDADGSGQFSVPAGQAIALDNPQWAFHSQAQPARGGRVQYEVDWQAPDAPGAANFLVSVVAGNGNGQNSGDYFTDGAVQFSFGCVPQTYYFDGDRDGAGDASLGTKLGCEAPAGYAATDDDCDSNDENVYPGAPERCNGRDDDCDGEIDEGLALLPRYPDADRDGFGSARGEPIMDCKNPIGYADNASDCDDADPARNPGALEVCDAIDNDCNGEVDDGAREICGVGLCSREAPSCLAACVPGEPSVEVCDGFDDDCDGETDEADACPPGQVCSGFDCVDAALAAGSHSEVGSDRAGSGSPQPPGAAGPQGTAGSQGAAGPQDSKFPAVEAPPSSGCVFSLASSGQAWLMTLGAVALVRRLRRRTI